MELLVSTLNKIFRNQDTFFVVILNNRLKIISLHGVQSVYNPSMVWEDFFPKKVSREGTKTFLGIEIMGRLF